MRYRNTLLSAALAACLVIPATASAGATLDALASSSAGRAITVECSTPDDAPEAGWTIVGSSSISISPAACRALGHLRDAKWLRGSTDHVARTDLAGAAVQVLVHEAMHLRLSSGDESLVECTASRNYWPLIASAHLPARVAQRVLRAAQRTHANLKSAAYRAGC